MPETPTSLILQIHMSESRQSWDGHLRGSFNAYVYGARATAPYEGDPCETLWRYDSPWARFALRADYGVLTLSEGDAYGFEWGFEPESTLVRACDIDRISKGLKKVERALAKFEKEDGRPQTLGQDVVRVMRALGITQACWKRPEGHAGYGTYRDWRIASTMEEVRSYIDGTIAACRQRQLDAQAA